MALADRWKIPSPYILMDMISYDTAMLWLYYFERESEAYEAERHEMVEPGKFLELHHGDGC